MSADPRSTLPTNPLGLLAIGSSDAWEVTVEEALGGDPEWEAEIEGPNFYMTFPLESLQTLRDTVVYLRNRVQGHGTQTTKPAEMALGRFGASEITLVWDNEEFARCFFIVKDSEGSAIRLAVMGDQTGKLLEAFERAVEQLPADV